MRWTIKSKYLSSVISPALCFFIIERTILLQVMHWLLTAALTIDSNAFNHIVDSNALTIVSCSTAFANASHRSNVRLSLPCIYDVNRSYSGDQCFLLGFDLISYHRANKSLIDGGFCQTSKSTIKYDGLISEMIDMHQPLSLPPRHATFHELQAWGRGTYQVLCPQTYSWWFCFLYNARYSESSR